MIQPLWRTVWRVLTKLKLELPYHPAIPLLGIYLEKTIMFVAALFTIAKTWKQPWIKKTWCIYIYNGILLSHKKE